MIIKENTLPEGAIAHSIENTEIWLLPEKVIYWPEKNILIISDLHLGKAMHFRRAGIPVPAAVHDVDLDRLELLVTKYTPEKVIFTGDLFHSDYNNEWPLFMAWRNEHPEVTFILVTGNHDILPEEIYQSSGIETVPLLLEITPFIFSHDLLPEGKRNSLYNITGHIHPVYRLTGKAKQSLRLPCFFFSATFAILPSFGRFTGGYAIEKEEKDSVFVIADGKVLAV